MPHPAQPTPAELRAVIEAATDDDATSTYDGCGNRAGGLVLEFMERHPDAATMPADSEYDWTDFDGEGMPPIKTVGLYEYMKEAEPEWYKAHENVWSNLTGFLWGWAVNAARYSLDLPPVANPAIMTINIGDEA